MKMEKKMTKTFKLFGATIEVVVDVVGDDDMVDNAPSVMNQEQETSSSRVAIPQRLGLEFPPGACCIIKKKLKASDVASVQSRFLIPNCKEILLQVLTDAERDTILDENKSMKVKVMDSRQCYFVMNFKKWPSLNKLVLNKGWMKLVKANQLKEGDVVAIWCYRQDSRLCFAVDICERSNISITD